MDIKDLAGLSDPLKKLFEVVDGWVGRASKAYFTKKDADAAAYTIQQISQAIDDARKAGVHVEYKNNEIAQISPLMPDKSELLLLAERAASREQHRLLIEQQNIEQVTAQAAEELKGEETVSAEAVDPDWIARFFDAARNISNEEMQLIWGKILAGEVKRPKTYSLRTLELLRNISSDEAQIFVKVAKQAMKRGDGRSFVPDLEHGKCLEEIFGITLNDLLLLREIGLLESTELVSKILPTETETTDTFIYGNILIVLERPGPHGGFSFSIKRFTKVAEELLPLITVEPDLQFVKKFGSHLKRPDCTVRYGTIVAHEGDQFRIESVQEIV